MSKYVVREELFIKAPANLLFDLVADPRQHPHLDGSGTVRSADIEAPERLSLGATFSMGMRMGLPYRMGSTVVEFEEGKRIAWRPSAGQIWRYTFTPTDGGTVVAEEWDARGSRLRLLFVLAGFPSRNRRGMAATLERLREITETPTEL